MNPVENLRHERHRIFVEEYVYGSEGGKPFSIAAAAKVAGYESGAAGYKIYAREDVREAISYLMKNLYMPREEVIQRLDTIARLEVGEMLDIDKHTGKIRIDPEKLERMRPFVKSFGYDSNGNPKIEFHDSVDALKSIGKVHGIFKEGLDLAGVKSGSVEMKITFVGADENPNENPSDENPNEDSEEDSDDW